jgi:hypothetical protein
MDWVLGILNACQTSATYNYAADRAEIILLGAALLFLLMRKNYRGALTLGLGGTLCYANYYMLSRQFYYTLPLAHSVAFAAVSSFLLILLVYDLIHAT